MKINSGIVAMVTGVFLFMTQTKAQTGVANNRETQSPAGNYYYYPEIDTWYDIPNSRFVYFENGRWIYSGMISGKYRYYNIANAYKVQVSEKRPYLHADAYRTLYQDYYTAYQNRFRNRGVLATVHIENNDRIYNRPVREWRPATQEDRRVEEQPMENKASRQSKTPAHTEPPVPAELPKNKDVYEPERFEEHKPVERGEIKSPEKTDRLSIDSKTGIHAKEENRTHMEPVKKEPIAPVKVEGPAKTDSIPAIIRLPGGSREAQYSDKFKKRVEGQ